jgi:sarcosine oxidase
MPSPYDVVVVGLGAMGGSAAVHLAQRGLRVLGLDRHRPPHAWGSSHGKSRLIREAYYEHPLYVPLVRRAYELWRALSPDSLLRRTGSLMVGSPESEIVRGTIASATAHGVAHEVFDARALARRFQTFAPLEDMVGVYEPGSSLLQPESIIALQLQVASSAGAELRYHTRVLAWEPVLGGIEVQTDKGSFVSRQLVLATGAWVSDLIPVEVMPVTVERQLQQWWEPARFPQMFRGDQMPVSMWQLSDQRIFYTMPDLGAGMKIGWHHSGRTVTADSVDRDVSPQEQAELNDLLRRFLPHAKGQRLGHEVCLYTNTPDGHFVIDRYPGVERVLIVSACSGHGFKFASVVGEIVADLLTTGRSAFDLTPFRLARFQ